LLIFLLDAKLREAASTASQPRCIRGVRLCSFNSPFSAAVLLTSFHMTVPPLRLSSFLTSIQWKLLPLKSWITWQRALEVLTMLARWE